MDAEKIAKPRTLEARAGTPAEAEAARWAAGALAAKQPSGVAGPAHGGAEEAVAVREERWCIGRFIRDGKRPEYFAGPVAPVGSLSGFGFPGGRVGGAAGELSTFSSREEAERVIATYGGEVGAVGHDRPVRVADIHFSVEHFSHYDCSKRVVYDSGDYDAARSALGLELARTVRDNYAKVTLEARLRDGLALDAREPIALGPSSAAALGGESAPRLVEAIDAG